MCVCVCVFIYTLCICLYKYIDVNLYILSVSHNTSSASTFLVGRIFRRATFSVSSYSNQYKKDRKLPPLLSFWLVIFTCNAIIIKKK